MGVGTKARSRSAIAAPHEARASLVAALRNVMRARGLSQTATAELLGTDQPTLSKLLSGGHHNVSIDRLVRWLAALGETVEIRVPGVETAQAPIEVYPHV